MFPTISIQHDLDKLADWGRHVASEQLPFVTALSLTLTGQDAKAAVEREMGTAFDRPTPYTMRGFRLIPATKARLEARLVFRQSHQSNARDYLGPQILGGERKLKAFERSLASAGVLPRGMQALPGEAAQLDQFGNMARSQIVQLLSYFQAFGEQGYRANMTDKRKAQLAKVGRTEGGFKTINGVQYFVVSKTKTVRGRQQDLPEGIWSRSGLHGMNVAPVVIFIRRSHYARRFRFFELVEETVRGRLSTNFNIAWRRALSTARR